ncbi:hypothetical protein ANN_04202 [Periplaneta americana]|uniref:DUF4817 domain-containing protein n=1 Tax=Periplaneta americana TaxID=6978 RepID=A0ABQ8T8M8_PERAM|nr:hypothetical protein ANN_04202 [Periplaneta americana]
MKDLHQISDASSDVDDPEEFVSATYSTSLHSSEKGKEKNLQAFHGNFPEKKKKFKATKGTELTGSAIFFRDWIESLKKMTEVVIENLTATIQLTWLRTREELFHIQRRECLFHSKQIDIHSIQAVPKEHLNKKMASVQEKSQCVEWFIETRSDIQVQRRFRTRYRKHPPSRPSIRKWYNNLMQTGGVDVEHHTGRPRTSEEDTELIRLSFQPSPQKSVRTASRDLLFQQDGAPPHWALEVRRTLDNTFSARWIGRGGPLAWPPRSPDLTPLDFFLWRFVKDKVYRTRVIDLDDLKARIRAAIASVDIDMLRRVWTELEFRLDVNFKGAQNSQ